MRCAGLAGKGRGVVIGGLKRLAEAAVMRRPLKRSWVGCFGALRLLGAFDHR